MEEHVAEDPVIGSPLLSSYFFSCGHLFHHRQWDAHRVREITVAILLFIARAPRLVGSQ